MKNEAKEADEVDCMKMNYGILLMVLLVACSLGFAGNTPCSVSGGEVTCMLAKENATFVIAIPDPYDGTPQTVANILGEGAMTQTGEGAATQTAVAVTAWGVVVELGRGETQTSIEEITPRGGMTFDFQNGGPIFYNFGVVFQKLSRPGYGMWASLSK